ncbi:MAG: oligopeptide/dipeptide ABC transporter ATP-binding protein, partial [Ilumatobacteraceae bacterium]
ASLPRLDRPDRELTPIGGVPPRLYEEPQGCSFAPRCRYAVDACHEVEPPLERVDASMVACTVLPMRSRTAEGSL